MYVEVRKDKQDITIYRWCIPTTNLIVQHNVSSFILLLCSFDPISTFVVLSLYNFDSILGTNNEIEDVGREQMQKFSNNMFSLPS